MGVFILVNSKGAVHEIEALLIFLIAVIIAGTEKIIKAIKEKESNVMVGKIKEVSEVKEVK